MSSKQFQGPFNCTSSTAVCCMLLVCRHFARLLCMEDDWTNRELCPECLRTFYFSLPCDVALLKKKKGWQCKHNHIISSLIDAPVSLRMALTWIHWISYNKKWDLVIFCFGFKCTAFLIFQMAFNTVTVLLYKLSLVILLWSTGLETTFPEEHSAFWITVLSQMK